MVLVSGAGGAAKKEVVSVDTRMVCLRRNFSGMLLGRKLIMASKARSVAGGEERG